MLKAELIDKTGTIIATVRQTETWTHNFGGFISIPNSWSMDNTVYEEDFLLSCSIKWDGCSHFWYKGQDYLSDEEIYPYYHECGLNYYYKHFIAKLFAFEVAKHYMKAHVKNIEENMDDDLYNTIDRINILDFYTIKYSEVDEKNDYVYEEYLEKGKSE